MVRAATRRSSGRCIFLAATLVIATLEDIFCVGSTLTSTHGEHVLKALVDEAATLKALLLLSKADAIPL